jgi:hypothetical protein
MMPKQHWNETCDSAAGMDGAQVTIAETASSYLHAILSIVRHSLLKP